MARALVHSLRGDIDAVEGDATGGGWDEADDHVKRRGLAGAVGAEEADDFAGAEVNTDASNDGARAE